MPVLVGSVECAGSENKLLDCSYVSGDNEAVTGCDSRQIAAVQCQGKENTSGMFDCSVCEKECFRLFMLLNIYHSFNAIVSSMGATDCTTGQVRLANFTDDLEKATRQGTMQICINRAWGTVCADNFLDTTDAEVFCHQLEGFKRDGQVSLCDHGIYCICLLCHRCCCTSD